MSLEHQIDLSVTVFSFIFLCTGDSQLVQVSQFRIFRFYRLILHIPYLRGSFHTFKVCLSGSSEIAIAVSVVLFGYLIFGAVGFHLFSDVDFHLLHGRDFFSSYASSVLSMMELSIGDGMVDMARHGGAAAGWVALVFPFASCLILKHVVVHLVVAIVLERLQFPDTDRALFQLQFERLARAKGTPPRARRAAARRVLQRPHAHRGLFCYAPGVGDAACRLRGMAPAWHGACVA